ncbi:MAG: tRNA nucleotidyltransferase, partial [Veillonella nakazawae]
MMEQANRILTVLEEAGYEAYIIGGAVRDILMHQKPHDFDIVTSARPNTVIEVLR